MARGVQKTSMVAETADEVIMSDDKLPARYNKSSSPPSPVDRVHSAVSDQSLLGRVVSGFVARLNTHTIERNTQELQAHIAYTETVGKLGDASLERDRKIARYRDDRDEIIADDRAQHRFQMEQNRLERERKLREAKQSDELAALRHQAAVSEAKLQSERAQWGRDAFNQSLPYRQERLDHLFKSGALDAEIEMLMRDKDVAKLARNGETAEPNRTGVLEHILTELNHEIELAQKTHAGDEVMIALHGFRARLTSILEAEKKPA